MQLADYFNPISDLLFSNHLGKSTFGASISVYTEVFPNLDGAHIALMGVEGWGDD